MSPEEWAPLAGLIGLCTVGAWFDLTQRRISNLLCGVIAVGGLAVAVVQGGVGGLGGHALHMVLALLGGMALFALGGFGGGDAKFYAGVAAWFGLGQAVQLLLCVALAGLSLLIVWFSYRRARKLPVRKTQGGPFEGLPYGVAIAGGAIAAALL